MKLEFFCEILIQALMNLIHFMKENYKSTEKLEETYILKCQVISIKLIIQLRERMKTKRIHIFG